MNIDITKINLQSFQIQVFDKDLRKDVFEFIHEIIVMSNKILGLIQRPDSFRKVLKICIQDTNTHISNLNQNINRNLRTIQSPTSYKPIYATPQAKNQMKFNLVSQNLNMSQVRSSLQIPGPDVNNFTIPTPNQSFYRRSTGKICSPKS